MKTQTLKFVIFVHKDLVKTQYGAERHDLLGYIIKDIFHLSNQLGLQLNILTDREGVTDTDYCTRTIQFEMINPNTMKPYQTNSNEKRSIIDRQDRVLNREAIGNV